MSFLKSLYVSESAKPSLIEFIPFKSVKQPTLGKRLSGTLGYLRHKPALKTSSGSLKTK